MSVKIKVLKDNTKNISNGVNQLKSKEIAIGVFDPEIAEYATYNEFGTKKIPERSFLRSTYDEQIGKWQGQLQKGFNDILDMKTNGNKVLEKTGKIAKKDVIKKVKSNIPPENKPSTIAKKGKGKPTLYDTGALWDAIDYEVRQK